MITMSFRFSKKKALALTLALAVLAGGGFVVRERMMSKTVANSEGTVKLSGKNPTVKTADQRLAFIAQFGWEVQAEPVEVREVIIPQEFDDVFTKYNYLQKQQGYDLLKQRGKRCRRYTYQVTNYPGGIGDVRINLIVYKDKVVGGDVSTTSLDGFMHGFDVATATTWLSIPGQTPEGAPVEGTAQTDSPTAQTDDKTDATGTLPTGTGLSPDAFPMAGSPEGEAAGKGMLD